MNFETLRKNLEAAGFTVKVFDTAAQASDYLTDTLHGKTIGFGGSMTTTAMGLYEKLGKDNTVYNHAPAYDGPEILPLAAQAQVYISSVNGAAETGELINIDGNGNRVAATFYGREKVILVIGQNKVAPDFDQALWRARNIAAPLNARRLGCKTPCALGDEIKCYNCKSPDRICRGLTVLWRPMRGVGETEVLLVKEDLGY